MLELNKYSINKIEDLKDFSDIFAPISLKYGEYSHISFET